MKNHNRLKLFTMSLLVVITVIFTTFTLIQASDDHDPGKDVIVGKIVQFLKDRKVKGLEERLKNIANTVYEESETYDLDYRLVLAVMKVESNFRHDAVSRDGARGLLQIKPALAKHVSNDTGVRLKNARSLNEPEKNIKIGVSHLSWLVDKFENMNTALHAYNAGPRKAEARLASNKVYQTPFARKVLQEYERICTELPDVADR